MKRIALTLALFLVPSLAWAQCSGVFPANTVCGNATASSTTPRATAASSFTNTSVTIGTTPIAGGTTLQVLYDNGGKFGEYTATQLTALMNLATASLSGALPAWPNNTTTFFRGDGSYATLNCAALTNGAASCSTDTTVATNITSGTLPAARLPAFGSGDVSFASGGGAGTIAGHAVTNAKAAQANANTMKGNWTGSTADLTDNSMPSCSDSGGNHLNYVTNTGITCGTSSTGTAVVLLNTISCPNSGSDKCADTTSLTATYSSYEIVFLNILPATTSTTLELQVHSAAAFPATVYLNETIVASGAGTSVVNATTFVQLSQSSLVINSGGGVSGKIQIYNPSQTVSPKQITGLTAHTSTATNYAGVTVAGQWNGGNTAIDGFQILFSSGNITSGTIKIYGVL